MFWAEQKDNDPGLIKKAWMTGENIMIILTPQQGNMPTALAIDAQHNTLYWSDRKLNSISSMNLNGMNKHTLVSSVETAHFVPSMQIFKVFFRFFRRLLWLNSFFAEI